MQGLLKLLCGVVPFKNKYDYGYVTLAISLTYSGITCRSAHLLRVSGG